MGAEDEEEIKIITIMIVGASQFLRSYNYYDGSCGVSACLITKGMVVTGRIRRIRRHGLVGESVLQGLCFDVSKAQARARSTQSVDQDVTFSSSYSTEGATILHTMMTHAIRNYTSATVSKPQLNAFLFKSCCGHGVYSQQ